MSSGEETEKSLDISSNPCVNESSLVANSKPAVFQCCQCQSIVGDSTSWVTANKLLRTITLGTVSNKVGVRPDVKISTNGIDKGSTFQLVYCLSCDENLGQQYLASPPELDYLRGSFTLHVEKLNSYEVGGGNSNTSGMADMLNVPSPQFMLLRMDKMQSFMISMNDRLQKLEACIVGQSPEQVQSKRTSHNEMNINNGDIQSVSSSENLSTRAQTCSVGAASMGSASVDLHRNSYNRPASITRPDEYMTRPLNQSDILEDLSVINREGRRSHRSQTQRKRLLKRSNPNQ